MKGTHHLLVGLGAGFVSIAVILGLTQQTWSWQVILLSIGLGGLFGVLPDIDHKMSHITWNLMGVGLAGIFLGRLLKREKWSAFGLGLVSLVYCTARFVKHRGLTHRWWVLLLVAGLVFPVWMKWELVVVAWCGGLSHLWGDKYFKN